LKRLQSLPVEIRTRTELKRIENNRAIVTFQDAEVDLGQFDSHVVAVGNRAFTPLLEELQKEGIAVTTAGDAQKPARIYDAVLSGHKAAMSI
jgi:NADPH-dependent 2,4-dienoyl-CoA reductase/sulfur reductase-like enzyme